MSLTLFIISICSYLISMVGGLIAAFFVGHIPKKVITWFAIFHIVIFGVWLIIKNNDDTIFNPGYSNIVFLLFFCSGVFIAGMFLRSSYPIYYKIYFSTFLLSLVVFIISPSRVLGFIASGSVKAINPARFHVSENYFLVAQQETKLMNTNKSLKPFKLVREMGMFYKTLSRDVLLPETTDSLHLLESNFDKLVTIRVYFYEESKADSLEMKINIGNVKENSKTIQQIRN